MPITFTPHLINSILNPSVKAIQALLLMQYPTQPGQTIRPKKRKNLIKMGAFKSLLTSICAERKTKKNLQEIFTKMENSHLSTFLSLPQRRNSKKKKPLQIRRFCCSEQKCKMLFPSPSGYIGYILVDTAIKLKLNNSLSSFTILPEVEIG